MKRLVHSQLTSHISLFLMGGATHQPAILSPACHFFAVFYLLPSSWVLSNIALLAQNHTIATKVLSYITTHFIHWHNIQLKITKICWRLFFNSCQTNIDDAIVQDIHYSLTVEEMVCQCHECETVITKWKCEILVLNV